VIKIKSELVKKKNMSNWYKEHLRKVVGVNEILERIKRIATNKRYDYKTRIEIIEELFRQYLYEDEIESILDYLREKDIDLCFKLMVAWSSKPDIKSRLYLLGR